MVIKYFLFNFAALLTIASYWDIFLNLLFN
nr:MAG TPA: hypothetical protein [Caudoviricetes sp.]